MKYAFQDRENLYLVMDLLAGGDLRFHICCFRRFNEEQTSRVLLLIEFFAACIIAGLEFIHSNSILHRDIKPENLVFEENGYLRITDFGIARKWSPDNSKETSGTPGYMAPEVMCRQNHGMEVDYFALGVILYECMLGRVVYNLIQRPYVGRSRKEIRDQILAKQVLIKKEEIPKGWNVESADFINSLIQRKQSKRLGLNGINEIKNHPWLNNYPWDKLLKKELKPPFKPDTKSVFEYAQHISEDETEPNLQIKSMHYLRRKSVQELFSSYYYEANPRRSVSGPKSASVKKRLNSQKMTNSNLGSTLFGRKKDLRLAYE